MKKKRRLDLIVFLGLDIIIRIIKALGIELLTIKGFDIGTALLIVFLSSFFLYYSVIFIYDRSKMDPILVEDLKEKTEEKKESTKHSSTTRRILWFKKFGNKKFLLLALICIDPIVTVIYYRKGHHQWNGIPKETIWLFIISLMFCTISFSGIYRLFSGLIKMIFN